ncbi:hypothetical protein NC661_13405 [Aquibacillus koreensis]|uniref:DUF6199 domain-containing protein n=1 Tax=Aquibacillus koreensis TaxID=279446 RepID=A0A9X3WKC9_9BACI|nr:hypothetical protein [Aquibacillus koreensis]MCT2536282.1 hypothetical protein [Aquibacillus koreensis]MDC3421367.1 hypothetical protein [Aquibacillus koreensis]
MSLKKFKQMISENILLKILLSIIILGLAFLYCKSFFSYGIYFGHDQVFLKKKETVSEIQYIGDNWRGNYQITIKGEKNDRASADVTYELPNNIKRDFKIKLKDANNWEKGIENIENENGKIVLSENGQIVDEPIVDIGFEEYGESPYTDDYQVPLRSIEDLVIGAEDRIRGEVTLVIIAFFIFIYTAIDYKFPLLFFKLSNFLEVRDPEPHDFYLFMQRLSWYMFPIIGLIILVLALYWAIIM